MYAISMDPSQTIVAIASSVGGAGRIVLRLSGSDATSLAQRLCPEWSPRAGVQRAEMALGRLRVGVWVYCFPGPNSYTGEDVVELHLPGNALLARRATEGLLAAGARSAEPGEFTARAYFNGRMDLTEAEGVAATIAAHSERELLAARQLLSGELARRLRPAMDSLAETLALVEVGIDFSDEDVTFLSASDASQRMAQVQEDLATLLADSARFERLSHEPRIVLVGRPNAGKSTLLNALAGQQRAVVSPQAGTTRDVLWAQAALMRGTVHIVDAAGLEDDDTADAPTAGASDRLGESDPLHEIAQAMRRRALAAVEEADAVVLVREVNDARPPINLPRRADLVVWSKADLSSGAGSASSAERGILVSALTGLGMDHLRKALDELAFGSEAATPSIALNARHLAAIDEARRALEEAQRDLAAGAEVLALHLRDALDALGQILGTITPDDLLGRIFSQFCIGK